MKILGEKAKIFLNTLYLVDKLKLVEDDDARRAETGLDAAAHIWPVVFKGKILDISKAYFLFSYYLQNNVDIRQ